MFMSFREKLGVERSRGFRRAVFLLSMVVSKFWWRVGVLVLFDIVRFLGISC